MKRTLLTLLTLLAAATTHAQETPAPTQMNFEDYEPKSTLVVPEHPRTRAKFPFIDIHNHQPRNMSPAEVAKLVADMDRIGMAVMNHAVIRARCDAGR